MKKPNVKPVLLSQGHPHPRQLPKSHAWSHAPASSHKGRVSGRSGAGGAKLQLLQSDNQ